VTDEQGREAGRIGGQNDAVLSGQVLNQGAFMKATFIVGSALALSSIVTIHAQRSSEPNAGPGFKTFNAATPVEAKVLKGQPYSAEVVSQTIQTLADGNRIVQRTTGRVYRDSEGRVRREEDRASGTPSISIVDPTAGLSFALDPANRIARESPNALLPLTIRLLTDHNGLIETAKLATVGGMVRGTGSGDFLYARPGTVATPGGKADEQTLEEKLPDRVIEGVLASGLRRTTTIAKGAIGNEQPLKIVSEEWTSPELQVLVLTDHDDPRSGRSTYRLLKINRIDPDPLLMQVPSDYTIQRGPGRGGRATLPGGDGEPRSR